MLLHFLAGWRKDPCLFPDLKMAQSTRRLQRDGAMSDAWYHHHPPRPGMSIVRHSDHLSPNVWMRTPFYQQHVKPTGMVHGASLLFWSGSSLTACLTLLRTERHGDFRSGEMDTLETLYHLVLDDSVRKLALIHRLKAERTAMVQAIYQSPRSLAVVGPDGAIVAASKQALRVIRAWHGNGALTHKLHHGPAELPARLREWCRQAEWTEVPSHPKWSASVVPLSTADHRRDERYRLLHFETRTPARERTSPKLTHTEIDLVDHLCAGRTNREIARRRGTSPFTVKCQVSALLQKFGCANRTALAVLFAPTRSSPSNGSHAI